MIVSAVLDSHIRLRDADIPDDAREALVTELSFPNRDRERARKEHMWGWRDMPEEISLWEDDGGEVLIPRGFRHRFEVGLGAMGHEVAWDDRRTADRVFVVNEPFELRPQQGPAADTILREEDGIYESPPGSGKTVAVLEVVRRAGMRRNCIVVNEIGIAQQWVRAAERFVPGISVGIVGDGIWEDDRRLVIATNQTLYARRHELERDGWFRQFGLSCLDECHHQTAQTFVDVMSRFWSRYRFGVSATPDKTGDFEWAEVVLGEVVHRTTRHQLREHGFLVRPTIRVVETGFDFPFHSTFRVSRAKGCPLEGCTKKGNHVHRNNYTEMMQALRRDRTRNALVARYIRSDMGHRQLVVSPQVGHLRLIRKVAGDIGVPALSLTGKESRKQRGRVRDAVHDGPCVVYATIAKEALDLPPLDRLHMPWPTKNVGLVRQYVGRVERAAEGKEDAVAYDYADLSQPVLGKQFSERRWGCYAPDLMRVTYVPDSG